MPLYEFFCTKCELLHEEIFKSDARPETVPCECGGQAEYRVGRPAMFRVKYEQNGRIGYKHDMGNGVKTHRSATREHYEKTAGSRTAKDFKEMGSDRNKSIYTKEYDRHVRAKEKQKTERANKELKQILKGNK